MNAPTPLVRPPSFLLGATLAFTILVSGGRAQSVFSDPNYAYVMSPANLPFPIWQHATNGGILLRDMNNDGKLDAIVSEADPFIEIAFGDGAGGFGTATVNLIPSVGPNPPGDLNYLADTGDINGDGLADVVTVTGQLVKFHLNQGNGVLQSSNFFTGLASVRWSTVLLTDLDGDGRAELVIGGSYFAGTYPGVVAIYSYSTSAGTFVPSTNLVLGPTEQLGAVTIADINHDGLYDIVVSTFDPAGPTSVRVFTNTSALTFAQPVSVAVPTPSWCPTCQSPVPYYLRTGDVNLDGVDDVVGFGSAGQYTLWTFLGSATGAVVPLPPRALGGSTAISTGLFDRLAGDIDGDGYPEYLLFNTIVRFAPATSPVGVMHLPVAAGYPYPIANVSSLVQEDAGDVDGDGDIDVVVAAPIPNGSQPPPNFGWLVKLGVCFNRTIDHAGCVAGAGPGLYVPIGTPALGNAAFTLGISGASPGSAAILGLSLGGAPLAVPGCTLWIDTAANQLLLPVGSLGLMTTDATGAATATLSIPTTPGLMFSSYFAQWLVADASGPITLAGASYSSSISRRILIW
ncbi:MAG: VCBS repeat-containing protein [Gemmataceae bacterium]|nr:VCBS repeat-containing protein [Gemmataceae bacterium]